MEPLEYPGKSKRELEAAAKTEATSIGQAIRGISGPLIRQIRRFQTLTTCLGALTPQLKEHCAPFDVKMVSGQGGDPICAVYWYASSQTAQAALESRKRAMLQTINETSVQQVDDFRYEIAGPERIRQQLNILTAGPD